MDQITAIEDAIIAMLQALDVKLQAAVLPYPDKNFEEYEPLHGNGEILVAYVEDGYGKLEDIGLVIQEREMYFELTFIFSSLRSVGKVAGLYAHLELVRDTLTGWFGPNCVKKTAPDGTTRVKRYKKRWWQYVQSWKLTTMNIETAPDETGGLIRITAKHDGRPDIEITNS